MHFSKPTLLILAIVALAAGSAEAGKDPKSDRAELGAVIYKYNMGDTVGVSIQPNQHVICDTCPKTQLLAAYKEPVVNKLKMNDMEPAPRREKTGVEDKAIPVAQIKPLPPSERYLATIQFKLNGHKLDAIGNAEIDRVAKELKEQQVAGETLIRVDGYTCKLGSKKHNDKLAVRRAKSVAAALKRHGINVTNITGEGVCCYVDNMHPEPNRRVEIFEKQITKPER